jgi:hypothetical protein
MKEEFSFYEFIGILVPSVILLYVSQLIIEPAYKEGSYENCSMAGNSAWINWCFLRGLRWLRWPHNLGVIVRQ